MFNQTKHIDQAFRQVRNFALLIVAGALILVGLALYQMRIVSHDAEQKIFILLNGKALEAFAADRKDNLPVEARDHIRTFHELFFNLDPDDKVIKANISRALYLADGSAKKEYDDLKEGGYYSGMVSGNISQQIGIDSISLDMNSYPYYFKCLAKEKLIRTTSITTRNLITEGYLRNVQRSDNNPHGFLIERWMIVENRDIKTEGR
jgi:conjugative transposon TraK protein